MSKKEELSEYLRKKEKFDNPKKFPCYIWDEETQQNVVRPVDTEDFQYPIPVLSNIRKKLNDPQQPLTEQEELFLEGYKALRHNLDNKFRPGAYVRLVLNTGSVECTILGKDIDGNFLVQFGLNSTGIIRNSDIVNGYFLRSNALVPSDSYQIGKGIYRRIVDSDGYITAFFDRRMESRRVNRSKIRIPESQRPIKGSEWGMVTRYPEDQEKDDT